MPEIVPVRSALLLFVIFEMSRIDPDPNPKCSWVVLSVGTDLVSETVKLNYNIFILLVTSHLKYSKMAFKNTKNKMKKTKENKEVN